MLVQHHDKWQHHDKLTAQRSVRLVTPLAGWFRSSILDCLGAPLAGNWVGFDSFPAWQRTTRPANSERAMATIDSLPLLGYIMMKAGASVG